jgi:hypothetical protein
MILINLLPQEYRRKNRTPVRFTVGVCAAVAINCSLLAWWAWLGFGVRAEVESELSVHTDTMDSISPQIAYHRSLERENTLYLSREKTLHGITSNRMSWAQKIDQLIDVVNRGGDGEKYLVWFNDLSVEQLSDTRRNSYGGIRAGGHSGNPNFAHVANFLEDLEASPFAIDFLPPAPPEGSQSSVDKGLMPAEVWSFPLDLDLLAPDDRRAAHDAAVTAKEESHE